MTGKFALITGGSRGLGSVLVRRFWTQGYNIAAVSRTVPGIESVLRNLPMRDGQIAVPFACDLGNLPEVSKLVEKVKQLFPKLDVLVNNAATQGPIGELEFNDLSEWQRTIDINLLAPVMLSKGLIDSLARSETGSIINLSGGGATGPRARFSAYAASKSALVRFSETLSVELNPKRIQVNCIAPGAMKTAMLEEVLATGALAGEKELAIAKRVFDGDGASMDQVADLALFLASDRGRGVTGKVISAVWDNWHLWPEHLAELSGSDAYTLRRITGRDRGYAWGDK